LTQPITITKGVRRDCPILPTLFKIQINHIITEWKEEDIKGVKIMTFLFADKQVTLAYSVDALHIYIHKLETITSKYGVEISKRKTKIIAFKGRDPIRRKTVINNNIIEQTLSITYVVLLHKRMKKMLKFKSGISRDNGILKPSQVQRQTRLKIYS
jgi:hypothetical protein